MGTRRFQHTIQMPDDLEKLWKQYQSAHGGVSFNAFVLDLIRKAVSKK